LEMINFWGLDTDWIAKFWVITKKF